MAIDMGTEVARITKVDRTWRIEVFISDDDTHEFRFHHEIRATDEGTGEYTSDQSVPVVVRGQGTIEDKEYSAGGITATGTQVLQLLHEMSDVERQVDIDTPAPERGMPRLQPAPPIPPQPEPPTD